MLIPTLCLHPRIEQTGFTHVNEHVDELLGQDFTAALEVLLLHPFLKLLYLYIVPRKKTVMT